MKREFVGRGGEAKGIRAALGVEEENVKGD